MSTATPITELLAQLGQGNQGALQRLMPAVYQELKALAQSRLAQERAGHTLSATALVHEAYLRMVGSELPDLRDRQHFIAVAAIAMRRVLVDHARSLNRDKRGPGQIRASLSEVGAELGADPSELLELDAALTRLDQIDPEMVRVVELRWFGGLNAVDSGVALGLSERTVARRWTQARAWLLKELDASSD